MYLVATLSRRRAGFLMQKVQGEENSVTISYHHRRHGYDEQIPFFLRKVKEEKQKKKNRTKIHAHAPKKKANEKEKYGACTTK